MLQNMDNENYIVPGGAGEAPVEEVDEALAGEGRPGFAERLEAFKERDIPLLGRTLSGSRISWGILLLAAFALYALVNLAIIIIRIFG